MNQTTRSRFLRLDSLQPPFLFLHVLASMQLKKQEMSTEEGIGNKGESMKLGSSDPAVQQNEQ